MRYLITMRSLILCLILSISGLSMPAMAAFGNNQAASFNANPHKFIPVNQAFPFHAYQDKNQLMLDWQVHDGYYLYQERLSLKGKNINLAKIDQADGTPHKDEFLGEVHIYQQPLFITIDLKDWQQDAQVIVQYQGCAAAGFCYPPETRTINIQAFTPADLQATQTAVTQPVTASRNSAPSASLTADSSPATTATQLPEQDSLAQGLANSWWAPLLFLALGVGLAFTPCVLPMYPILTSIVLGQGKQSPRQAFKLAFIYVQGMAATYTILGLIVASAGMQFQAAMQHPYVLIAISVLFVVLALSMFGVYTLQLPSRVQTWLSQLSNQQQGGRIWGVFIMGAISGLVCSPCTTAPLSGALIYVAQSGDLITGAIALYALALGMGIPLILVAVFGNKLLPKAGAWMDHVKHLFGFILLAAPIFLLTRIIPHDWAQLLWSLLGLSFFGWLYHLKNNFLDKSWQQSFIAIIAILGLLLSAQPLIERVLGVNNPVITQHPTPTITFTKVTNLAELQQQLTLAKQQHKPVMLDFYADWCVACKEFEKYTFHQPEVMQRLQGFVLLQADVTKNQPQDIKMLQAMKVLGLPTIIFWDKQGQQPQHSRLTGFMQAEPFLQHIQDF